MSPQTLRTRSAKARQALASVARCVGGRRRKAMSGRVPAAIYGTPSIPAESVRPVFTGGPKPSAFRVIAGRRIPPGMRIDGEKPGDSPATHPALHLRKQRFYESRLAGSAVRLWSCSFDFVHRSECEAQ